MGGTTDTIIGAAVAVGVLGVGLKMMDKATNLKKGKKRKSRGFI